MEWRGLGENTRGRVRSPELKTGGLGEDLGHRRREFVKAIFQAPFVSL
jgi:hypothetical protein